MMPEYYCKSCNKLMCGMCHQARKDPHDKSHKVVTATDDIVDKVTEALAKLSV